MSDILKVGLIILLIVVILVGIYRGVFTASSEDMEIVVQDKERLDDGRYLIFTEDEVLENTDKMVFFKFNSSDFYNELEVGEEFEVRVVGWRVPFLSWYRNIIEIY